MFTKPGFRVLFLHNFHLVLFWYNHRQLYRKPLRKTVKTLKLLLLAAVLFSLTACDEKKTEAVKETSKPSIPVKESNVTLPQKKDSNLSETVKIHTFTLSDINDDNRTIAIVNKHIEIEGVSEKIIVLNFFASWCPPCKGQLPYLADLQKKYKGKLFIAGLLLNDSSKKEILQKFLTDHAVNYYVSAAKQNNDIMALVKKRLQLEEGFPLPLTMLFKDGHYYSHYIGAVPVEMLEHDIKNAMGKE